MQNKTKTGKAKKIKKQVKQKQNSKFRKHGNSYFDYRRAGSPISSSD